MIGFEKLIEAVLLIGYYIPKEQPKLFGTGFLIGKGDRALTCAHVVIPAENMKNNIPKSLPLRKQINGKSAELSCWAFRSKDNDHHLMRFRINNIVVMMEHHIESFYLGEFPDVAYLELDISQWVDRFGDEEMVVLQVSDYILRSIGAEVIMVGYPSPDILMLNHNSNKTKCMEPMTQFMRISGVLPFSRAQLPEFLAFDKVFAGGSSGSPIIEVSTGNVIAIASQLLPFYFPTKISETDEIPIYVPSSIGFGVPSNFFYELSLSKTGIGKFSFDYP